MGRPPHFAHRRPSLRRSSTSRSRAGSGALVPEQSRRLLVAELVRERHIIVSPRSRREAERGGEEQGRRSGPAHSGRRGLRGSRAANTRRRATRDAGGESGCSGRGMILEEFERVAFQIVQARSATRSSPRWASTSSSAAEYTRPRSHAAQVRLLERRLRSRDGAGGQHRARARRQLLRGIRTARRATRPATARGHADRNEHVIGQRVNASDLVEYFKRRRNTAPGSVVPGVQLSRVSLRRVVGRQYLGTRPFRPGRGAPGGARPLPPGEQRARAERQAAELDSMARAVVVLQPRPLLAGSRPWARVGSGRPCRVWAARRSSTRSPSGRGVVAPPSSADADRLDRVSAGVARVRLLERFDPDAVELANRWRASAGSPPNGISSGLREAQAEISGPSSIRNSGRQPCPVAGRFLGGCRLRAATHSARRRVRSCGESRSRVTDGGETRAVRGRRRAPVGWYGPCTRDCGILDRS